MKKIVVACVVLAAMGATSAMAKEPARLIAGTETSLPRLVTSHGTYKLGKKPYPAGTRAKWIAEGRALAAAPAGYLPPSRMLKGAADNRSYLPPIGDQGSLGSCVHWAGTYYTKSANMKRMNPALNLNQTSNQCSPRFTYNLSNNGADNGGYGHEPFEIFMRYGVASLNQLPYTTDYTTLPTIANFAEGLHRRTTNYVWVWDWNPGTTEINQLKAWLDAGGIASCGVYAETTFDAWGPGDAPWVGTTCTIDDINHMVTVCGYGTGYYLVANSWTTSFGSNGYIVVDSDYFENYFSDVLYPLEGSYTPATNYAKIQISHNTRSDIRSLVFTVNGTTVWTNSPLPKNLPKGTGSFDTDSRNDWQMLVDLGSAPWTGANTVTARCSDAVTGTAGTLTNFTLYFGGTNFVSASTPVSIPDNTGVPAAAVVSTAAPTNEPPVFGANPGPVSATTGVAAVFTVATSAGYPAPVLALQSTTASTGYTFTAGTGQLSYTSPLADVGAQTFTFTATNSSGAATQTVSVTVYEAPPAAPGAIWASATNTADFTAAWSSVSGATGYRLDVGTNATFSSGSGGGGSNLVAEGFASASPAGWTISAGGTYSSAPYVGTNLSGTYSIKFSTTGDSALTPAFAAGATNLQFWSYGNGGSGSTFAVSGLVGSVWTLVDTVTIASGAGIYNVTLDPQTTQIRFGFTKSYNCALDDVIVQAGAGGPPSYVAGYSNRTVAGTSQSVTGLAANATYYFRARAVSGGGTGAVSAVASVTTLASLSAPVFGANPGPAATTSGVAVAFTVSASGVPAPTLALQGTTASSGYSFTAGTGQLTYTPPQADTGARTFTFTASNSQGVATQTVSVTVTAATAPAFTGGAGPYNTTSGVAVAFTVSASGVPAATLALAGTTASSGYNFTAGTGQLTYTPPGGDVGTQTFTFTASNVAGVATQVTSVAVAEAETIPAAPAAIWASATNATDFTAAWSAVANAASYRLDVGTNATFTGGGGAGGQFQLASNAATSPSTLTNDWSGASLAGTTYIQMLQASSSITSPAFSTAGFTNLTVDTRARTYGGVNAANNTITVSISTNNGSGWTVVGTMVPGGSSFATMPPLTNTANLGHAQTRIRWQTLGASGTVGAGVSNLVVQGWSSGGGAPAYVDGYSNRTVAGMSQAVTGLVEGATYYFRARAVNGAGTSPNSATASVTTAASGPQDQTITFPAIGAQVTTSTVTLAATASSGLAVSFAVGSGPATISGGTTLTFTGAGTVSIVASQAGNGSWNPALNVTNSFSVTKAAAGVALNNLLQTYDGTARTVTATTMPAGLTVSLTYNGSGTAPTAAGSYAVTGTVSDAMYQGAATGQLVVAKAAAGVALSNLSHVHDGTPKSATVTTTPLGLAVNVTYDGSGTAPSAVGSYTVVALVAEANYAGGATDTLSIAAATVTNQFQEWLENDQGQSTNDPDFAPAADIDGDGATTWDEFLADTDPNASNEVLVLSGSYFNAAQTSNTTGQIRFTFPASTNRFYQLEYCTGLTNHQVGVTNLGWGVPGMTVTNGTTGTWYGVIRVFLQEP